MPGQFNGSHAADQSAKTVERRTTLRSASPYCFSLLPRAMVLRAPFLQVQLKRAEGLPRVGDATTVAFPSWAVSIKQ